MGKPVKLLIAENRQLLLLGIEHVASTLTEVVVQGEITTWTQMESLLQHHQPDILLLSLDLMPLPLQEALLTLRRGWPGLKIILMGIDANQLCIQGLLKNGAHGYVLHTDPKETIRTAIRVVNADGYYFSQSLLQSAICPLSKTTPATNLLCTLTPRECQIFELAVTGKDATQIAIALNIKQQTIRNYLSNIYQKIGVQSQAELIVQAGQNNSIDK